MKIGRSHPGQGGTWDRLWTSPEALILLSLFYKQCPTTISYTTITLCLVLWESRDNLKSMHTHTHELPCHFIKGLKYSWAWVSMGNPVANPLHYERMSVHSCIHTNLQARARQREKHQQYLKARNKLLSGNWPGCVHWFSAVFWTSHRNEESRHKGPRTPNTKERGCQ